MRQTDFSFVNDVRAAVELRTPRTSRMLLMTILALMFVGLVWASLAVLDEVKRGSGRVIPTRQMQVVQTLEGGIVREILSQEGAIVKKDQPLMRIDDTNFAAQFGEIRERRAAMAARVQRLEAETKGMTKPEFSKELTEMVARAVAAELAVFEARSKKLEQEIQVLSQQQSQKSLELDELRAQEAKLSQNWQFISREVELTRQLHNQKIVPEIEMLRVDRQASEIRGQLNVIKATIAKGESAFQEAQSRISTAHATFRSQAQEELAKSKGDLAVLDENIKSAQDRVLRTELRSPVYGIVNKVNVTTVGAVVQPGANVMDIVPLEDSLLVEGRIRPQDIAFIRPDQDAVVKITAYDASVYGSLKGKVERISADAIAERNEKGEVGETFYRVIVRTDKNALGTQEHPLPIIPGMVATVEVLTGSKTVLDYLLKPARLLRDEALRER